MKPEIQLSQLHIINRRGSDQLPGLGHHGLQAGSHGGIALFYGPFQGHAFNRLPHFDHGADIAAVQSAAVMLHNRSQHLQRSVPGVIIDKNALPGHHPQKPLPFHIGHAGVYCGFTDSHLLRHLPFAGQGGSDRQLPAQNQAFHSLNKQLLHGRRYNLRKSHRLPSIWSDQDHFFIFYLI